MSHVSRVADKLRYIAELSLEGKIFFDERPAGSVGGGFGSVA